MTKLGKAGYGGSQKPVWLRGTRQALIALHRKRKAHSLLYRHTRFELPYIQSHPLDHIKPHTLQFPPATPFNKMATDASPISSTLNTSTLTLIILTALLALGGGIYLSGAGDPIGKYLAEQFFRGKATAEKKALEHVGEEKARGFLYVSFPPLSPHIFGIFLVLDCGAWGAGYGVYSYG